MLSFNLVVWGGVEGGGGKRKIVSGRIEPRESCFHLPWDLPGTGFVFILLQGKSEKTWILQTKK